MKRFSRLKILGGAAGFLAILLPFVFCEIKKENVEAQAFPMKEISAFDIKDMTDFRRGQNVECKDKPEPEVKAWPAFKSEKPVYGIARFVGEYGDENSGVKYYFAVDEQGGTGKGYDRLYFDINHDMDLTNDPPIKQMSNPPNGAFFGYDYIKKEIIFDYIRLEFELGGGKKRTCELLPHLIIRKNDFKTLYLISTRLRTGEVDIAGKKYTAYLGFTHGIGTGYNWPDTALHLIPKDSAERKPSWWGSDSLKAIHRFGGIPFGGYYQFFTTAEGDQLFVKPYTGDFGRLEIGEGGRKIDKKEASGSLNSLTAAVAVGGEFDEWGSLKPVPSCMIPVGEYSPCYISINYGRLRIAMSENYHSDGKPMKRDGKPFLQAIKIQKDKPFVLDFTNKPEVMFASPAKDHRVKAGEKLSVEAVLVDPVLDAMIRGLDDTTRKMTKGGSERDLSLDPKVTIARSDGEIVAQGDMPFG